MHVGDTVTFVHELKDKHGNTKDISSAEKIELRFMRPDKTVFSVGAFLYTDGLDGKLKCTLLPADLNIHGKWKRQMHIKLPTDEWSGNIHDFAVLFRLTPDV